MYDHLTQEFFEWESGLCCSTYFLTWRRPECVVHLGEKLAQGLARHGGGWKASGKEKQQPSIFLALVFFLFFFWKWREGWENSCPFDCLCCKLPTEQLGNWGKVAWECSSLQIARLLLWNSCRRNRTKSDVLKILIIAYVGIVSFTECREIKWMLVNQVILSCRCQSMQ